MHRALPVVLAVLLTAASPAQVVTRRAGRVVVEADQAQAFPGGLVSVRLRSGRAFGTAYAVLDGRRCPFFRAAGSWRALVPIPATFRAGPATVGVEIRRGRGRQRIAVPLEIAAREYAERTVALPDLKLALLLQPSVVRDGRQLQLVLRTISPERYWRGSFSPPVSGAAAEGYGVRVSYPGASPVEATMDAIHGEYHRGLDYDVPVGTVVQAPAAGTVLLAAPLTLSGQTVALDHGHGVISVFFHLSQIDVRPGDRIEARAPIGLSGESGLAVRPHLHWAVYVLGVAVDPQVMERLTD
jgi:murein DD-endopeptidase MepM/ murein hydrolase activator NlpD